MTVTAAQRRVLKEVDTGMVYLDPDGHFRNIRSQVQLAAGTVMTLIRNELVEYDPLMTSFLRLSERGKTELSSFGVRVSR